MIVKTVKILKNNWKKSIFFTGLVSYGVNYFHTSHKINCLMKEYCENATKFGEERLSVFAQPKHVTVILNPRSKKSKSRKYFNDYVAPIFHCAGYKVSIVETENQGQAVQLMEIMSNTDAVLIAGGSGTIQEAITGLLRRDDANQYARNLPIGFLPLGTNNRTFNKIYKENYSDLNIRSKRLLEAKILAKSAMKILDDKRTNLNVIQIQNLDDQKTVFSLNKFEFGILSELTRKFPKYWYLGDYLAQYYVYLKSTLFNRLNIYELGPSLSMNYRAKCAGCSKCFNEFRSQELDNAKQRSGGWFSMFRSVDQRKSDHVQLNYENKLKNTINKECGQWKTILVDRPMNVQIENCPKSDLPELKVKIFRNSDDLKKRKFFDFLKSYPDQQDDGQINSIELNVRDLRFNISCFDLKKEVVNSEIQDVVKLDSNKINDSKQNKIGNKKESDEKGPNKKENKLDYLIDDENYDVKNNLEFNSKFRKILIFC